MSTPVTLRLSFVPRGGGAILLWQADVLGTRLSRLSLPLPAADLDLVIRALDVLQDPAYPYPRTADQARNFSFTANEQARLTALELWHPSERLAPDMPRRLGQRLYHALTADPPGRTALATLRDHAVAVARPLKLDLCFPPGTARLAALPWELLWDEEVAPLLLGRGLLGSLARRLDLPQALPPTRCGLGPLRILVIAPLAGISAELRQIERAARTAALAPLVERGLAIVRELEPASRTDLMHALEAEGPPDIVHFYGHGRLNNGLGELLLDDPLGAGWISAGALAASLSGVGLVTLFACHGAAGAAVPLGGVAQALIAAGVPAVLGMQLAVRATAASRAAAALYAGLAAGTTVEEGVARARRALFAEEQDGASWFVPALYLRHREDGPFCLRPPSGPPGPPPGAQQQVIATAGGTIRALRIQGRPGSHQRVLATSGGSISNVVIQER